MMQLCWHVPHVYWPLLLPMGQGQGSLLRCCWPWKWVWCREASIKLMYLCFTSPGLYIHFGFIDRNKICIVLVLMWKCRSLSALWTIWWSKLCIMTENQKGKQFLLCSNAQHLSVKSSYIFNCFLQKGDLGAATNQPVLLCIWLGIFYFIEMVLEKIMDLGFWDFH